MFKYMFKLFTFIEANKKRTKNSSIILLVGTIFIKGKLYQSISTFKTTVEKSFILKTEYLLRIFILNSQTFLSYGYLLFFFLFHVFNRLTEKHQKQVQSKRKPQKKPWNSNCRTVY